MAMNRVSDLSTYKQFFPEKREIEEFDGVDLVLTRVSFSEGEQGEFAAIHCYVDDPDEPFLLTCGGMNVVPLLKHIHENNAFPIVARFEKQGRMWTMV